MSFSQCDGIPNCNCISFLCILLILLPLEGTVPHIPWCETPLQPESFLIQPQLAKLNRCGLLTINSQPPVDGASSSHTAFGWGGKGGKVYQKAYFECFVSPAKANKLTQLVTNHPSVNMYAINNSGHELRVGVEEGGVTALTWGVFPNREILQPVSRCLSRLSKHILVNLDETIR